MGIIAALVIGAIAGWLAGKIVRGAGFGLIGNIVVGIVGALVAGWVLPQLGVHLAVGWVGSILDATIGAVIVLVILSLIRRARRICVFHLKRPPQAGGRFPAPAEAEPLLKNKQGKAR